MKTYKHSEIQALAEEALASAIQTIQQRLGVTSGDVASHYFQGHTERVMDDILRGYIRTEISWGNEQ